MKTFYHTSEGSDVVPLSWLLALKAKDGKPFLRKAEELGMLHDEADRRGVPVGLAIDQPLKIFGLGDMAGFNCAACHVGELRYRDATLRILGAPNLFDIKKYYGELFEAAKALLDPRRLWDFLVALHELDDRERITELGLTKDDRPDAERKVWASSKTFDKLQQGTEDERALAERIKQVYETAPPLDEESTVPPLTPDSPAGKAMLGTKLEAFGTKEVDTNKSMLGLVPRESRLASLLGILNELRDAARLLKARVKLFALLGKVEDRPEAGPGRVDAFNTARSILFPDGKPSVPSRSPVSFPHLWGFGNVRWLHWDGNTDSIMERNIGQAIGLGAVVADKSGLSSVRIRNIDTLEQMARRLAPPKWPEDILPALKPALVAAGADAFKKAKCDTCHTDPAGGEDPKVGTDPGRLETFASAMNGKAYAPQLREILVLVRDAGYSREGISPQDRLRFDRPTSVWRPVELGQSNAYASRPLNGIWASAPYLHNGSVPTLRALLTGDRPASFLVGSKYFDPEDVGIDIKSGPFEFKAAEAGNKNVGHLYGTPLDPDASARLSKDETTALIEYLKSL